LPRAESTHRASQTVTAAGAASLLAQAPSPSSTIGTNLIRLFTGGVMTQTK